MQEVFYYLSSAECEDGDVEYLGFKKPTPFALPVGSMVEGPVPPSWHGSGPFYLEVVCYTLGLEGWVMCECKVAFGATISGKSEEIEKDLRSSGWIEQYELVPELRERFG